MNISLGVVLILLLKIVQPSKRSLDHIAHLSGWFTGLNICVEVEFLDDPVAPIFDFHHESMRCSGNNEQYVCYVTLSNGKTIKKTYECCPGYERKRAKFHGCKRVIGESSQMNKNHLSKYYSR